MPPRRPRRRARRRSPARPVTLVIAAVVVLAVLVGGLTQVSRQSQGYDVNSDRALAAQGTVAADQSNATSATVRKIFNDLPTQTRQGLQATLDGAVQETGLESARAQVAAGSTPLGTVATQFAAVFADRAEAMSQLRAAVYGYLGMQPIPPANAPAGDTLPAAGATPILSATQATNRIAAAGALLTRSDALYRSVRRSLAAAPGHATLPPSVWVTDPQVWQLGSVAAQVDLVATSPTLTATHYVVLRTVRLNPPALPTPPGAPANVSVISPTSQISVTVVLANQGSSNEPHVTVRVSLEDQTSGATTNQVRTTSLALAASVTLPDVTLRVKPSTSYLLTVQVIPPAGQTLLAGTATEVPLQVAPGT
jgi:hypothetical protein